MQGILYLLFVSLCLSCAVFAEVKDNETLIYHWDVYHKIYYYCQFGTKEQIEKSFQSECFKRNKNMQHILSDGTKTFPYVAYGSSVGFILKCDDVPEADLHSCKKLLYTSCNYTCKGSNVTREMACQLRGPIESVTAQWSIAQPCSDNPGHSVEPVTKLTVLGSSYGKVSAHPLTSMVTTSTTLSTAAFNNSSLAKFTTSSVMTAETPKVAASNNSSAQFTTSPLMTAKTMAAVAKGPSTILLASIITPLVVLVLVAIFLILLYKYYRKRRRRNFRNKFEQPVSSDEKNSFENTIIAFSRTNAESTSPLMDVEGEDNQQKSSSVSETNSSIGFDSWDKTKQQLENDIAAEPARPEQCCACVSLLQRQTGAYCRNLRAQLEVISCRSREQALIGYMEQHMRDFNYQSLNELKVLEQSFERQVEEKVSDLFLRVLAAYDVKIGYIMEYFYQHRNWDAIGAILQVHKECPYCEQFRRSRDPFVCG